jgi:hypothetical protein
MGILIAYLLGILTTIKPEDHNRNRDKRIADSHDSQRLPQGLLSVMCIPRALSDQEQAEKEHKERRETTSFWVRIGSLVILVIYAGFTILIWWANKQTTDLFSKQLESTQAAIVEIFQVTIEGPDPNHSALYSINARMRNSGNGIAHGVNLNLKITTWNLPNEEIVGTPISWEEAIGELPHTPDRDQQAILKTKAITIEDISLIDTTKQAILMSGTISFDNGFRRELINQPVCFVVESFPPDTQHLSSLQTCGNFELALAHWKARKR